MNGSSAISGEIYDGNNNLQSENVRLKLEATGSLKADWFTKGFLISRADPFSLKVEVFENLTGEDFNFVIMLQSGDQIERIQISQSQSLGFDFEKIEYTLLPESHIKTWGGSLDFVYSLPPDNTTKDILYPFYMEKDRVTFYCDTPRDYKWIQRDQTIWIDVPHGVYQGELYYNSEKAIYKNSFYYFPLALSGTEYPVYPPGGDSKGYIEVERVEFQASFRLYIRNRVTQKIKTCSGILKRKYPTGQANTVWL